jgi:hypothetical protein
VGSTSLAADNVQTFSVNKPAGVTTGDQMLAVIANRGSATVTAPTGWTQVRADASGTSFRQTVFRKTATATEPASYSFRLSAAGTGTTAAITAYRGVDGTNPIVANGFTNTATTTTATGVPAPGVAGVAGGYTVGVFGTSRATTFLPPSAPTGTTERVDVTSGAAATFKVTMEIADVATAGTTTPAWSARPANVGSAGIGQTITLRPAG